MYSIIWVVIIVGIAIYQWAMAPGKTELRGEPFEGERKVLRQRQPQPPEKPPTPRIEAPTVSAEESLAVKAPIAPLPVHSQQETAVQLSPADLWQAIIMSEVLARPKSQRRHRR